ncbi:uncharacterized protein LOC143882994 [Tasmannia lanceolata]|uniref:uncharacterized protein LOC143882994 n=1 Tax=Tasmannia lanceolata TaxID=3420 RepID=UPI0040635144
MSDSSSSVESGSESSSSSSSSELRPLQKPVMASPASRVDIIDSDDGGDRDEVILDLNATPLPTDSLHRVGGSGGSDFAEASTTFLPGRAVEVIARARMEANPKYNMRALVEENHLTESMLGDIRDKYCVPLRFELRAAIEGDRACNESQDLCIYEESLRAGLRFPLHPFFTAVLRYYGLAPAQVAPNSWRFFYVEDKEATEAWPVPLVWDTPNTTGLSRKPLLEGEDARTFTLMRKEVERTGLIHCSDFSSEDILVGLEMKKQSTVEKIRQGAQPRAQEGAQQALQERQKRKASELASPAPSRDTAPRPAQKAKTTVKLVGPFAQGGGSSKSGGTSTGTRVGARPPVRSSDNVFRPNWAVQKDDTGLGESRVAAEIVSKCLLVKDKQQVIHEPLATGEEAVFSSLYQIGVYYNDLKEKSKKFFDAITKSEEVNGKLATEVKELQTSIGRVEAEKKLLAEDLASERQKLDKAAEAMDAQRRRAKERQETAVKGALEAKEAELFSLSSEAYSLGYYDCLQELQACNPNLVMANLSLPSRPTIVDEEPEAPANTAADAAVDTATIPDAS